MSVLWAEKIVCVCEGLIARERERAENTHRWGKYHCTAGLLFYKFGFSCFTTYKKDHTFFLGQVQSCKTGDQLYSDPSFL